MQEIREKVVACLKGYSLPDQATELFGDLYSPASNTFPLQESLHWDYKQDFPKNLSGDYFGGIVRLISALHNTYGGLIIFGVHDKTRLPGCNDQTIDVEALNHVLRNILNNAVEILHRRYVLLGEGGDLSEINVLLVPKRPSDTTPTRLKVAVGKYAPGIIWGRYGHEVLEVKARELSFFYMPREDYGLDPTRAHESFAIHRSLPGSPATSKEFVGRAVIMDELWGWLTKSDSARLFLCGPGGSGKSTLAYEFARSVAKSGRCITTVQGGPLDFVVFLSAKETELNPFTGTIERFQRKDFSDTNELFQKMLVHSGISSEDDVRDASADLLKVKLRELMDGFQGLFVIDDIDALSRRNLDPGMEALFEILLRSKRGSKVLYTLRNIPAVVRASSVSVPGLDFESEYLPFVQNFCTQLKLQQPDLGFVSGPLADASSRLPLVVEIILALKRTCSTYKEALDLYELHKGEQARQYMFIREYDRLPDDRPRLLLAALAELGGPANTEALRAILKCSTEQLSEAISEVSEIFLKEVDWSGTETRYEILPVARSFVEDRSRTLTRYAQLRATVHWFNSEYLPDIPQITNLELQIQPAIERDDFSEALKIVKNQRYEAMVTEHPRYKALLGEIFAKQRVPIYSDARDAFQAAWNGGYRNLRYLRAWFYMEINSGSYISSAVAVCELVVNCPEMRPSAKSEFYSKRGQAFRKLARQSGQYDVNGLLTNYSASVASYLSAYGIVTKNTLDPEKTTEWLQAAFAEYVALIIRNKFDRALNEFLKEQAKAKRPIDPIADAIIRYYEAMSRTDKPEDAKRFVGNIERIIGMLDARESIMFVYSGNKIKFKEDLRVCQSHFQARTRV